MAVDNSGFVYVCGDNTFRQLGVSLVDKVLLFKQVQDFTNRAIKVAAGVEHSMILTKEGEVFTAGNNAQGNLGLGHTYSSDNFLGVHGLQNIVFAQISAGRHSAAITDDNRLFVWGQVFKNESHLILPQELRSNKLIKLVSVGAKTTAIIDEDYHVYTWGFDNALGQLGRKDFATHDGNDVNMPQLIDSLALKQVTQVSAGLDFIISLGQDFDSHGQPIILEGSQGSSYYLPKDNAQSASYQIQNNSALRQPQQDLSNSSQNYSRPPFLEEGKDSMQQPQRQVPKQYEQNQLAIENDYENDPRHQRFEMQGRDPSINRGIANQSNLSQSSKRQANKDSIIPKEEQSSFSQSQGVPYDRTNSQDKYKPYTPPYQQQPLPQQQPSPIASGYVQQQTQPLTGYQSQMSPTPVGGYQSSQTNAELYKQMDVLREENFQLKQKQRELIKALNELKIENDQLLQNADQEIKRMGDFVDKYTQEVETNKRNMQAEYEEKLQSEKKKSDDLKKKFHSDQNDIEMKLDRLQREIEVLRQDNLSLQQQKSDTAKYQRDLQDQLQKSNQQLKEAQQQLSQQKDSNIRNFSSPSTVQTPIQKGQNREEAYKQTTPVNYQQAKPPIVQNERSNIKQPNSREKGDFYDYQAPLSRGNLRDTPQTNSIEKQSQPVRYEEQTIQQRFQKEDEKDKKYYTLDNKNNQSPYYQRPQQQDYNMRNDKGSEPRSSQYSRQVASPVQQDMPSYQFQQQQMQQQPPAQRPATYANYVETEDKPLDEYKKESYDNYKRYSERTPQQLQSSQTEQFQKPPAPSNQYQKYTQETAYQSNKARFESSSPLQTNTSSATKGPIQTDSFRKDAKDVPAHQRTGSSSGGVDTQPKATGGDNNALNDVKNRLQVMQKNKEELEEKLRNYEARIRSHYSRQQ